MKNCIQKKKIMKGLRIKYDSATGGDWIKIDPAVSQKDIEEGWAMLPYNWDNIFRKWICGCSKHDNQ